MSNDEVGGKSLATQELRLNVALPARILTTPSPASTRTSPAAMFLTTSVNRRAGTTASPSVSTLVAMLALIESSMSVEYSSSRPSRACSRMPESTGSALRVETPRARMLSFSTSVVRSQANLIPAPYYLSLVKRYLRVRHKWCGQCGKPTVCLRLR